MIRGNIWIEGVTLSVSHVSGVQGLTAKSNATPF